MNQPRRRTSLVVRFAIFAALSLLMVTGACVASRRETESIRTQRYAELHAIATLKIGQLVAWRNERLGDARTGADHLADRETLARWLTHPSDTPARKSLLQDLGMLRDAYGYRTAALLGTDGRVLLALDPPPGTADPSFVAQALQARGPVMGDIFREGEHGELHLDVMAQVPGPLQQPLAFLLLRVDPEVQLFPLIQSWPMPSETAETTLVRREGDQVRWLNRPRHSEAPPLSFTFPISRQDLSAVQVVLGRTGRFLGLDYRGVEVLADLNPVPGSPWFMTSKVDTREIMAEARYRTGVIQGFAALGILLCAMLLGFLFYLGEAKLYHGLFQVTRLAEHPGGDPDIALVQRLRRGAMFLGLLGLAIGIMLMFGWILGVSVLKGTLPGFASTKANTALGVMLVGAALACLGSSRPFHGVGRACSAMLLFLGALTLAENVFGLGPQIEQIPFGSPMGLYGLLAIGRMAPATAAISILIGGGLLLASFRRTAALSQWIALPVGLITLALLLGHLLGSFGGYGLSRYFQMNFPAVVASFTSSFGLLLLNPQDGLMRHVMARSMGGWLLRHVVPFLIGMPLLIAWIGAIVLRRAWLDPSLAAALAAVSFVAFLLAAAWWAAHSLDHLDAVRNQAEADLRESQSKLQLLLDSTAEAIYGIDLRGECTFCNRAFLRMMGYSSLEQVLGRNMHDLVHHSYQDGSPFPVEACRIFQAFQKSEETHVDDEVLWRADGTSFAAEYWSFPQFLDGRAIGAVVTFIDVTQRRQAQEGLRASREMLSHVLDTIPQSVFWKDPDSRYLGCNRAFAQQVGLEDPAQITGRTDFDLPWPREEAEAYRADDRQVMQSNQAKLHIVEPLQRADGSRLWIETSKVPLRDADGRPSGVLGIYEDTTERKRMEEALQRSEAHYRQFTDMLPMGVVAHQQGRIVFLNPAGMEIFRVQRSEDVIGTPLMDRVHPDDRERVRERVRAGQDESRPVPMNEEILVRMDGTSFMAEVAAHPISLNGQPAVMAVFSDITERKAAEDELRSSRHRLAEAQALAHLGNWELDLKSGALSWSEEIYRIFGLDPQHFKASYEAFLAAIHPDDRELVDRAFTASITNRTPYRIVHRLRMKDGTLKHVEERGQALYDSDGAPLRSVGTVQDITDLKLAEAALRESEERLRLLSDNLPGGMVYQVDTGEDGASRCFTYVSAGVQKLHGITPDQLMQNAMALYGQIREEDRAALAAEEATAIAAMAPFSGEYRIHHPSGEVRWFLASSSPHRLTNNHLVWDGIELDITERKLAEQALQATYTELQLTFQNMINAFVVWESVFDDSGRYVSFRFGLFNDAYSRISKLRLEDVRGKDVFEVWPDTEQSWVEAYGSVATTGVSRVFDMYHVSTQGWYHCNAYRPSDSPSRICVIFEDITERRMAEEKVREAERMARGTLDGLSKHIAIIDETGTLLAVNQAWRRFEQENGPVPASLCEGANYFEACAKATEEAAAEAALFAAGIRSVMNGSRSEYTQEYACHSPHVQRWFVARVTRFAGEGPVRVVVVHDNITERKLAENSLLGKTALLDMTGQMAKVGGWEFDTSTFQGTWTDEVARIHDLETPPENGIEGAFAFYSEASRPLIRRAVQDAIALGKPYDLELELTSAKGAFKIVRSTGVPVTDATGKVVRLRGIFQDITDKKLAEERIRASQAETRRLLEVADRSRRALLSLLEDQRESEGEIRRLNADLERRVADRTLELQGANRELEAFAYSVSHDLRAPLRHMEGFLSMLARHLGPRLDDKGSHYLSVAQGAAQRMGQLVEGLLSFSRLGRTELNVTKVDLDWLVASVLEEFKAELTDRKVTWKLHPLPAVQGDPTLLRLVFQNLVGNALKFTRNKPEALIEIAPIPGLEHEAGALVRDNGAGFDPAYAHKLFGVFQRLHREDEYEGTGIGLANVHRIVGRHGGRVWAEGRPGEGAVFYVAFPSLENPS